ncbi:MAG: hypothetical protein NVS2B17_11960 [Candidatus Velthaea sp.]
MTLVGAVGVPLAHVPLPGLDQYTVAFLMTAAMMSAATWAALAVLQRTEPHRSTAILASLYAANAVFASILLPYASGSRSVALYVYALSHITFAAGANVYIRASGMPSDRHSSLRRLLILGVAAIAFAAGASALVVAFAPRLPRTSGVSVFTLLGCLAAFGFALRARRRTAIDAALTLTLGAMVVDLTLMMSAGERFNVGWFAARLTYVWASSYMLFGIMLYAASAQRRVSASLDKQRRLGQEHARRLDALWRVSSEGDMSADERIRAILVEGAASLRPGFAGMLCRFGAGRMEVERTASQTATYLPADGTLNDEAACPIAFLMRDGVTRMWDDLAREPQIANDPRIVPTGWRAVIGTSFIVGSARHYVVFASSEPATPPFDRTDGAFVEVLATLCAAQLDARLQSERIRFAAEHDVVTGLRNRTAFRAALDEAIVRSTGAVLVIDVIGLAEVNRSYGESAGDHALLAFADLLRAQMHGDDFLARLGDDAFGIMLTSEGTADVMRRVEAIVGGLDSGIHLQPGNDQSGVFGRIGIARFPEDGNDAEAVTSRAFIAMQAARLKDARVEFYDVAAEATYVQRRTLLTDLRHGITAGEFSVYYQPEVNLVTGALVSAEALVRWQHPGRGTLLPETFAGFAEEQRCLAPIDDLVLAQVARDLPHILARAPHIRVFVNTAADRLERSGFARDALHVLAENRVAPSALGIEITETVAMRDVAGMRRALAELREGGISIALDDFGTGYSSLAHLKRLPLDAIKIDRGFINDFASDPSDAAIVGSIVDVARAFGFSVIAEGVEREDQARWLRERGCDIGQGYMFARPMPLEIFLDWVHRRRLQPPGLAAVTALRK